MTRAPVKLSREMKLLLLLLLMVGLIGLWYVLTNKPSTGDLAQQPPPPSTTGSGAGTGTTTPATGSAAPGNPDSVPITTPATPGTPATGSTGTAGTPLTVQPDSQVQVETIPPFPTDGTATATTPAPEPATPGGINPDGVISAAPGSNPFKPLRLDASATPGGTTPAASSPAVSAPVTQPATSDPTTATVPARPVTPAVDSLGNNGGPLGLSPIPGADGSVSVDSGSVSGGALPVPVIPGADGSTGTAATPVVVPVTPDSGSANTGGATTGSANPGTTNAGGATPATPGMPGTVVLTPPAPAKPPVVGVNVPGVVTRLPNVVATAPAADGAAGTATAGAGTATTALPTPGTPQVIRELTPAGGATPTSTGPAATPVSALEQYVRDQNLVFNAVVLGPINTAIFRGKDGYVVVASGQPLPDSKVVVGTVTATSATLNLGTDSKTLELDKR